MEDQGRGVPTIAARGPSCGGDHRIETKFVCRAMDPSVFCVDELEHGGPMRLRSILCITVLTLLATSAAGARTNCPGTYGNWNCTISGVTICAYDSGDGEYQCDGLGDLADELTLVSDANKVWAWGKKKIGSRSYQFCCDYGHGGTVPHAYVDAGEGDNIVKLSYLTENYAATSEIITGDGDDFIEGSTYTGCDYPCDSIYPGDGEDEVWAFSGNDNITCYYWDSDDLKSLNGGNGHDKIIGSGGDDEISGGDGDDWLIGGLGADDISGNDGTDTLWGGYGNDDLYTNGTPQGASERICGQQGSDDYCVRSEGYVEFYCDCDMQCKGEDGPGEETCILCENESMYHGFETCPSTGVGWWLYQ